MADDAGFAPTLLPPPGCGRWAKAPFGAAVLVCRKCARKLDGEGFGPDGDRSLRTALKRAAKSGAWGRKVRVVETACLDLCPKRRQVAAAADGLGRGRLLVIAPGADAAAVLDALLPRAAATPAQA